MDFSRPFALLLLLLVPFAVVAAKFDQSRRSVAWAAMGRSDRIATNRWGRWIWAMVALCLGLAGPRFGLAPNSELPPGHDIVILIDASRSMAAEDAVPNRLEAAKRAAAELIQAIEREPGARVAVVAFAGGLEPLCPLTDRFEAALDSLRTLKPGDVRPGGTSLAMALQASLEVFDETESSEGRSIVVFSDGEDLDGFDPTLLNRLTSTKVVFHAVTFGDSEAGQPIPFGPKRGVITYQGEVVLTRRRDDVLKKISQGTGGLLIAAGRSRADLESLYRERIAPTEAAHRIVSQVPERVDRAPWFLAAALGFLASWSWPRSSKMTMIAACLCVMIGAGSVRDATARGQKFYRQSRFQEALSEYEIALRSNQSSPLAAYNTAATLYQLGRYDDAARYYEQARVTADITLSIKIDFALGNVAVASGRYQDAITFYDRCLGSKSNGTLIKTVKGDAQANRAFAEKRLPPPASPDAQGNRRIPDRSKTSPSDTPKDESPPNGGNEPQSEPSAPPPKTNTRDSSPPPLTAGSPPLNSPKERLDEMLKEVRKAQAAGREGDRNLESSTSENRKDW